MAPLQDLQDRPAHATTDAGIAARLEGSVSSVVGRLFAAETAASPEQVLDAVVEAMAMLRDVLVQLHEITPQDATVQGTTEAVAQTLAILYPAKHELLRELRPQEVEPLPPLRRRPQPSTDERRVAERVHIEADIGFQSESNFFTGFSGNISSGGIFVATWEPLGIGTELTVSLVLPNGHQVTCRGRVTWVREPAGHDDDLIPGMGVEFEHLTAEDQAAVQGFIDRREPLFFED